MQNLIAPKEPKINYIHKSTSLKKIYMILKYMISLENQSTYNV